MKIQAPNFTQVPNAILDAIPSFTRGELSLLLYVCRETFGWHSKKANLTTKDFIKGTGLSTCTLTSAIKSSIKKGILNRQPIIKGRGAFFYSLTISETETVKSSTVSKTEMVTISETETITAVPIKYNKEIVQKKKNGYPEEIKTFAREWAERHFKILGTTPSITNQDMEVLKGFMASGITSEESLKVAERAWVNSGFWAKQSVCLKSFCKSFNQIRHEIGMNGNRNGNHKPTETYAELVATLGHKIA